MQTPRRTFVALDLETTGLDPQRDAIIEIGAVRFRADGILDRFTTLVNPQRPIPLYIQQLTGIRDQDVATAPTLDQVIPELLAFVDPQVDAVVAHNVNFDLGFLAAAGVRFHRPALDTCELATILLPGMPSYSLGELARQLDIRLDDAHRALDDAEAAARLFIHLLARIQELPRWILDILVESGDPADWPPLRLFADARATAPRTPATLTVDAPRPRSESGPGWQIQEDHPPRPVDEGLVTAFFAADGPLHRHLGSDYETREGQLRMAHLVLDALNRGDHRLIEAGTGTGKSLAYLLPAALWATANRHRVVIATHTIPLQDQLIGQEIPRLQALWPQIVSPESPPLRAALLKGRRRYLCTRRLHAWYRGRALKADELRFLAKVLVWLPQTTTGDVSELALRSDQERRYWEQVASDGACTPERCHAPLPEAPFPARDFFWLARRKAEQAHLLVVNHALLLADLESEGRVLPEYNHLIIDEAHHLEDAATEQLTLRADQATLTEWLGRLSLHPDLLNWMAPAGDELTAQARALHNRVRAFQTGPLATFYEDLQAFAKAWLKSGEGHNGYVQRLRLDARLRTQPRWSQIEMEWDQARRALHAILDAGRELHAGLLRLPGHEREPQATYLDELRMALDALEALDAGLETIVFQPTSAQETVTWLEYHKDRVTLCAAPAHVGDLLAQRLFRPRRTVILTGATLSTGAGIDFMADRLGCWHMDMVSIPSPFDYRKNVVVVLPTNMPMPNESGYQSAVEQAIVAAAQAARGRTLVLFTSHSHLRITAAAIRAPLNRAGIKVLEHGSSGRHQLLQAFRTDEPTVLLGTGTFWEGIDVPGEALSCLVIVRLPFAVPTDPLFAARAGLYEDPFNEYSVPDAVLRFRQGFGRLIRRANDRGAVVLLDSRVWKKRYGNAFLDALPACTVRRTPLANLGDVVADWLAARPVPALFAGEGFFPTPPMDDE